tara:strand:+ start:2127 stop:3161 length:1035 start_codon:yes stop_codon:yes gene_type:complete
MTNKYIKTKALINERKLYKISQLTSLLGITARTVRYYDQLGLLPNVKRTPGNMRLFDEQDIALIQKIRYFQEKEFLPLDVIKGRLFKETATDSQSITIVADNLLGNNHPKIHTVPGADSIDTPMPSRITGYTNCFQSLISQGFTTIYSYHSALSPNLEAATIAANTHQASAKIHILPTHSVGGGHHLYVTAIANVLQASDSENEVEMYTEKNKGLVLDVFMSDNLNLLFPKTETVTKLQQDLDAQRSAFNAIVTFKNDTFQLIDYYQNNTDAIDSIGLIIEEEAALRAGYLNAIAITYNRLYAEANALTNQFKSAYPKASISVTEADSHTQSMIQGDFIGVSVL